MRPLPGGYTHDVRGDGRSVVKRYTGPDAPARLATERDTLSRLGGALLAPRLLEAGDDFLILEHRPGQPGQELIRAGRAAAVLRSCGETLRTIQAYAGPGILVHGDYGPQNVLADPATGVVTAVLDWELAHDGDPVEDVAWCEWIVRMHHPEATGALDALFDGYGSRPPWPARHAAMLAKCRWLLDLPRPAGSPGIERRRRFLEVTESWTPEL